MLKGSLSSVFGGGGGLSSSITLIMPDLKRKKQDWSRTCTIQKGSEYWPFEYQTFWSSDFKWPVHGLCAMSHVLAQPFKIPDQYITKQDAVYLPGIQMVQLSSVQMKSEHLTIWHPTSSVIKIPTVLVFRQWLYTNWQIFLKKKKIRQSVCILA